MASAPGIARTIVLTLVALTAFAGNSILCRLALRDGAIDPVGFTALRLASGALVLAPFLLHGRERVWSLRSSAALFTYALGFSLAYVSLDTGTGALLLFGLVQVTMIAAGLRAGERPTPLRAAGIGTAVLGVVLLVAPGVSAPDAAGAALMALAGLAWGLYTLFGRGVASPTASTACNFLLAAPAGLVALALRWEQSSITSTGALLAVASGALTSALGYAIWYAALRGHSATSGAVVQLTVPVLAAAGGVILLGEEATPRLVGAGALTLGGVALAVRARGRSAAS